MKIKILSTMLLMCGVAYAQVNDSVSTMGGTQDVFYKLSGGSRTNAPNRQWDFAFTNVLVDASVLSNDAAGVEVYVASEDISNWDNLDTTDLNWKRIYNSEKSWAEGSFSNLGGVHPDYGWGQYNQSNHNVMAKRLFFVKLKDGSWRKMMIEKMETSGNVTFKTANLDGSNVKTNSFSKLTNKAFNFTYYDAVKDSFLTHEPATSDWDLSFSKYYSEVSPGAFYPVSGIKINRDAKVVQRDGVPVISNDTNGLVYGTKISEIGSDWKTYDQPNNKYVMVADRAYFVKLKNGEIWKIYFTGYTGGASATSYFTKEMITGGASTEYLAANRITVYPNPASGQFNILTDLNESNGNYLINFIDQKGSLVKTVKGNDSGFNVLTFSTSSFDAGMYIVELHAGNKISRTKLIVH